MLRRGFTRPSSPRDGAMISQPSTCKLKEAWQRARRMLTACHHGGACRCLVEDQDLSGRWLAQTPFRIPRYQRRYPLSGKDSLSPSQAKRAPTSCWRPIRRSAAFSLRASPRTIGDSAMGEDGTPNINLFTPIELTGDWRMADLRSVSYWRTIDRAHRRTIAATSWRSLMTVMAPARR